MGRDREYHNNAERQRAYRQRKARAEERLHRELYGRDGKDAKRKAVSAKLIKILGMLGSAHHGERDNAAVMATQILQAAGLTWYDILDTNKT